MFFFSLSGLQNSGQASFQHHTKGIFLTGVLISTFRYKERLQTSYIKSLKPSDTSKSLHGKNWLFLKDGLDDFRDGLPPPIEGDVTLKV